MHWEDGTEMCDDGATSRAKLDTKRRPSAAQHGHICRKRVAEQEGIVGRLIDVLVIGGAEVIERRHCDRRKFVHHGAQLILFSSSRERPSRP